MPFPLAHPAAVLPLSRIRWLSFPALVVGSIMPDVGYLFTRFLPNDHSHQVLGSVTFCLPVGLVGWWLATLWLPGLSRFLMGSSPEWLKACALCSWQRWASAAVSVLIGSWTHLLLDAFTHADTPLAGHFPWLGLRLLKVMGHSVRVCSVFWYLASFAGIVLLFLAYRGWMRNPGPALFRGVALKDVRDASLVALVILPIEVFHHVVRGRLGLYLVIVLSFLVVLVIAWRGSRAPRASGATVKGIQPPAPPAVPG
jgi:hypothetical protein